MIAALLVLARPDGVGAEVLLAAGLLAAVLAIAAVLRATTAPRLVAAAPTAHGFAALRVLLRASDPSAAGHRRARAPDPTR